MLSKKTNVPDLPIIEENIFSKPKYQAILSIIAHFQQNKKNIQRAHLIHALVKRENSNLILKDLLVNTNNNILNSKGQQDNDKTINKKQGMENDNILETGFIDRLQTYYDNAPKIMFNSIANLDKTIQNLRKLGLITNQYVRGYPCIILTEQGFKLFYKYIIKRMIDELVDDMSISNQILDSFISKEEKKNKIFLPELNFLDD
jgi:GR25 family glycosyltransferase involved in LPS biosynthesis